MGLRGADLNIAVFLDKATDAWGGIWQTGGEAAAVVGLAPRGPAG